MLVLMNTNGDRGLEGCDAAYETLAGAFGEPALVSSGFRWSVEKARTGRRAVVELTFPGGVSGRVTWPAVVWIFDPDAAGVSTFNSFDVGSADAMTWLKAEVRRLRGS